MRSPGRQMAGHVACRCHAVVVSLARRWRAVAGDRGTPRDVGWGSYGGNHGKVVFEGWSLMHKVCRGINVGAL